MDLKGSLVDTNLRIYPTDKLLEFIKTISPSDQIPHNILQIIKPDTKSTFKSYKLQDLKPVHLDKSELENLIKIRDSFDEILQVKSIVTKENDEGIEIMENKEVLVTKETVKKNLEINTKTVENKLDKEVNKECKNKGCEKENQKSSKEDLNSDNIELMDDGPFLVTSDIDWLYVHINIRRTNGENDIPYLHTLLKGVSIEMPGNEIIKRNPVLEARCVKLRSQQDAREYRKMTKSVDNVRMRYPEDSISYQMKQLNRHLIAIGQFIISIFAGFLFGFRGVEWMVGNLDFGFRLLLGVMCALVIALAEIYFLAKKLNEELCIPDTVQLGGPVKFADEDSYNYKNNESGSKPHQD